MRRLSLGMQVFLSILGVSLMTATIVGFFARTSLSAAFDRFLEGIGAIAPGMRGRGMGRMMLGAAEQTFVASVDRGVISAALLAVAIGTVVAVLLAAYLARPIRRLEEAAGRLAGGDLAQRVDAQGPAEVAALGDAFNVMADSLERAEQQRKQMVADVAHELRNPLAAARAQAEALADGVITPDRARFVSIVDDLTHLSALVDDLQELSLAEAGRLRYDMQQLDISALLAREAQSAESLLAPGVRLAVRVPDAPLHVLGDEMRLSQVIRNILSNAVRHTATGEIAVEAAHDGSLVRVSVIDSGEGIADEDLPHVFDRFYRADVSRASKTGGAGLGLAISRTIVRDHGGDVYADHAESGGAVVGFTLPAAAAPRR